MTTSPKFNVAICGGGLAGLALAVALQESAEDIHVDIYEAAAVFSEIGAGVSLWRRPWRALRRLGLYDELCKLTDIADDENELRIGFEMRKADQPIGVTFRRMMIPMGKLPFHRADFQGALITKLKPDKTTYHFGKRLVSYWQNTNPESAIGEKVALYFNDGTSSTCDLLVAADGIHSVIRARLMQEAAAAAAAQDTQRAELLRDKVSPVWSGWVAYRGVVPGVKITAFSPDHRTLKSPLNYVGKNRHVIAYPIMHNETLFINVVAFVARPDKEGTIYEGPIVQSCSQEELLAQYVGFEPEAQELLQCIDKPSRWAINALKGLPISTYGRVALVGDAAHAMTPHQGSGAGQAIEDAYILAKLLAHPKTTLRTLSNALKVYEAVRLPHANGVQQRSRTNGKLYELADERFADLARDIPPDGNPDDLARLRGLGDAMVENWEWAWNTVVDDDLAEAYRLLEERLVG